MPCHRNTLPYKLDNFHTNSARVDALLSDRDNNGIPYWGAEKAFAAKAIGRWPRSRSDRVFDGRICSINNVCCAT
jgi:hypothetical protein